VPCELRLNVCILFEQFSLEAKRSEKRGSTAVVSSFKPFNEPRGRLSNLMKALQPKKICKWIFQK